MKSAILFSLAGTAAAFTGSSSSVHHRQTSSAFRRSDLNMGGAKGYATTMDGKKERVETIKTLLDSSEMVFSVPAAALTVKQVSGLRRSLPEGTTMSVVKNKLMLRALDGTPYEAGNDLVVGPSMWFFIEEDIGGTIDAYNKFLKDAGKKETHNIVGGVIDGSVYDAAGVNAIGKLPSKLELMAQIAGGIKAVPTKVARVIKAPTSKLARAIKLATEESSE
eukprot:scaffold119824_cov57-Attheya_sp.AAC.2